MTARIDHEDQANQAAAAGKYDIAQYHALMLIAERLAPTYQTTIAEDIAAPRIMIGRDVDVVRDERWTVGRAS